MPPEWLEITAGVGAMLWSVAWVLLLLRPATLRGAAYRDLASLPSFAQIMIVLIAALGGILQIATAAVNDARLRYCVDIGMAAFFGLILIYVWGRVGYGPTVVTYLVLCSMSLVSVLLLKMSGYVRL